MEALEDVKNRLALVEGSLARLLDHLPGMAYRCKVIGDHNYILEYASKGCQLLLQLGLKDIEAIRNNIIERMTVEEDLPPARQEMRECIAARRHYEISYRIVMPDGSLKWIWDIGHGVMSTLGECEYLEGIMLDVTAQKDKETSLREENVQLRSAIKSSYGLGQIIGKSEAMQNVYSLISKAARSDTNVILFGETGVGKDLVARTVHELSGVKGRYVPVNCAAIPEQLLESAFFGHVKGAFSGASSNQQGFLGAAHEGTLFLDEVAELPVNLQVKLLRALESKTYTPVGSAEVKSSRFRLISATNQDLNEQVRLRNMRADFFYRINVLAIHIPPLRSRHGDLPLLIDAYARERGYPLELPLEVRLALERHNWPGNVRELQNVLDRYWAFGETGLLPPRPAKYAPGAAQYAENAEQAHPALRQSREDTEKKRIMDALEACNGRKAEAAEALGISLRTLQRKIKRYHNGH